MKAFIIPVVALIFLTACKDGKDLTLLRGTWQTDSVYTFYNGFSFTRHDITDEPLLQYAADGVLIMSIGDEVRSFSYEIVAPDTLRYFRNGDEVFESFVILDVQNDRLVLKKDLNPLFDTKAQHRYEVWYYSKVNHP